MVFNGALELGELLVEPVAVRADLLELGQRLLGRVLLGEPSLDDLLALLAGLARGA
jgi:hypothetical protein